MDPDGELPPPPYVGERAGGSGPEPRSRRGLLMGIGVAVMVLVATGAGLMVTLRSGNSPEGVVERFLKAYDNGQCTKATGYLRVSGEVERQWGRSCHVDADAFELASFDVVGVEPHPAGVATPRGAVDVALVECSMGLADQAKQERSSAVFVVARFEDDWRITGVPGAFVG